MFRLFKSKTSSRRSNRSRHHGKLRIEPLEDRKLLAVTAVMNGLMLEVRGTENADTIEVRQYNGELVVPGAQIQVNGQFQSSIAHTRVDEIHVWGFGGDDEIKIFVASDAPGCQNIEHTARLWGGDGNDVLVGGHCHDNLYGEDGGDRLEGRGGNDYVFGGSGNDGLAGGWDQDWLFGDEGVDVLSDYRRNDYLDGIEKEVIVKLRSDNILEVQGTEAADTIRVGEYNGRIYVHGALIQFDGRLDESLPASRVDEVHVKGFDGDDELKVFDASDGWQNMAHTARLWGGSGNDVLVGGNYHDNLYGESGHDTLDGRGGNDWVRGGSGDDFLSGGADVDTVIGDEGSDVLMGAKGNDYLDSIENSFLDVPYYGGNNDWNLNAINAPEVWAQGYTGRGVVVAVIDTGVDSAHYDLASQIWINPGEIAGNGIDDDKNGYVDDMRGWDFVDNDNGPDDHHFHGTHVAGTIAASKNGFGFTGVAPDATIMPVRVLNANGQGTWSAVADGIRYAARAGADIINLSLGGGASSAVFSAIQFAQQSGVLVVAAAGNGYATLPSYPARYSASLSNVLSVGAHDSSNVLASFSNDVGASGAVQVDAPGVDIASTIPYHGAAYASGTSMAAPHVAGLAALALSARGSLTPSQLRSLIVDGATRVISGSDARGGVNAAVTVAMAAAGKTGSAIVGGGSSFAAVESDGIDPPMCFLSFATANLFGNNMVESQSKRLHDPLCQSNEFEVADKRLPYIAALPAVANVARSTERAVDHLFAATGTEEAEESGAHCEDLFLADLELQWG